MAWRKLHLSSSGWDTDENLTAKFHRTADRTSWCQRDAFTSFFILLSLFPQISLPVLQQRLLQSPQSLWSVLNSSGWIITWEKAQSSGGLEISAVLLKGQMIPRSSSRQGEERCQKSGKEEMSHSTTVKWLKYPCYSLSALSRYLQDPNYKSSSHRICFQHANNSLVWARQGVLKPFYWSTSAPWHFPCSFVNDRLWIYRHRRGVFLSTLQSLLQREYELYFLEKGLQQ